MATQVYLHPFEEATGWGVFLPGDVPPHFAAYHDATHGLRAAAPK